MLRLTTKSRHQYKISTNFLRRKQLLSRAGGVYGGNTKTVCSGPNGGVTIGWLVTRA
jgi:hypothetical protein